MPEIPGYKGYAAKLLRRLGVSVGEIVQVKTEAFEHQGVLMPRYELADDRHIVLKLSSGYNIGVKADSIVTIRKVAKGESPAFTPPSKPQVNPALPRVSIISTGGTIASRVDYRTGGVRPALTAEELYSTVPELSDFAQIEAEVYSSIYSENMTSRHWGAIARKVEEKITRGYRGIVVTHGTDTMAYTAAALSFALSGTPVPVALVGAQRSSDRPSSDAASNLIGAVNFVSKAAFAGVYVVMHDGLGDDTLAVHSGVKVRKNHTSRRDAFQSVNIHPVAYIRGGVLETVAGDLPSRGGNATFKCKPKFEERVALLKFYPEFDPETFSHYLSKGLRGIVLEGTGLGHVSQACFRHLRRARDQEVLIGMTSQCIWGRVRMTVYETGRDLLSLGVIPLGDMLPETALVKMKWVIANSRDYGEARELLLRNLVGEYSDRSLLVRGR